MGDVVKPKDKMSTEDKIQVFCAIMMALTVIFGLIGIWIWALFGMSSEVGTAWGMTSVISLSVFSIVLTILEE